MTFLVKTINTYTSIFRPGKTINTLRFILYRRMNLTTNESMPLAPATTFVSNHLDDINEAVFRPYDYDYHDYHDYHDYDDANTVSAAATNITTSNNKVTFPDHNITAAIINDTITSTIQPTTLDIKQILPDHNITAAIINDTITSAIDSTTLDYEQTPLNFNNSHQSTNSLLDNITDTLNTTIVNSDNTNSSLYTTGITFLVMAAVLLFAISVLLCQYYRKYHDSEQIHQIYGSNNPKQVRGQSYSLNHDHTSNFDQRSNERDSYASDRSINVSSHESETDTAVL